MKVFLIAGTVLAVLAATAYYCLAVFFSANATEASRQAKKDAARIARNKKRRSAGA